MTNTDRLMQITRTLQSDVDRTVNDAISVPYYPADGIPSAHAVLDLLGATHSLKTAAEIAQRAACLHAIEVECLSVETVAQAAHLPVEVIVGWLDERNGVSA